MREDPMTVVQFFPSDKPYPCGYCKTDGSISDGMWTFYTSATVYKQLLDKGWRRSGKYIYKPNMEETCCPQYTIRCEAAKYKPTKSQKKVAKKVRNYLFRGSNKFPSEGSSSSKVAESESTSQIVGDSSKAAGGDVAGGDSNKQATASKSTESSQDVAAAAGQVQVVQASPNNCDNEETTVNTKRDTHDKMEIEKKKEDTTTTTEADSEAVTVSETDWRSLGIKKAKVRRMERNLNKSGLVQHKTQSASKEKSISDFLPSNQTSTQVLDALISQGGDEYKHKLELRLIKAHKSDYEFRKFYKESYAVYRKYQMIVHKDKEEDCDENTYNRFLCDSPIEYQQSPDKKVLLGSFHQHYVLDGKIIAVAVLDILPECLSSVYLYYDPDYSHLSLGTYSALRELQLCTVLGRKYYYMGYYIHSCHKMRYKGKYYPSELLSPTSGNWHPIEHCIKLLDKHKYSTFETDPELMVRKKCLDKYKVMMMVDGRHTLYTDAVYSQMCEKVRSRLQVYCDKVDKIAESILVIIPPQSPDNSDQSDSSSEEEN